MNIITKIEIQRNNNKRYSVFLDDKFAFGVHEDILIQFKLSVGSELSTDFIETVINAKEQNNANHCALNFLSSRARSTLEIETKLSQKGYEPHLIQGTVEFLEKYNYLNDKEFALSYSKDKINLNKLGEIRLKLELRHKGINDEIIDEVLDNLIDEDLEYDNAFNIAQKKLNSSYKNDDRNGQYRKLSGFLQRKGYSFTTISKIMKELL